MNITIVETKPSHEEISKARLWIKNGKVEKSMFGFKGHILVDRDGNFKIYAPQND